jgi:hypothetical protein
VKVSFAVPGESGKRKGEWGKVHAKEQERFGFK